jgi:hypothetical protein
MGLGALTAGILLLPLLPVAVGGQGEANLAIVSWDRPAASLLEPFHGIGRLLAHNEDFAVMTLPPGFTPAGRFVEVGPVRSAGAYFLFLSEDALAARFETPAEVLYRDGHTTLLWTPGDVPRLTDSSALDLEGLRQLQRITRTAKPWPQEVAEADEPFRGTTEFSPEVDRIVQEIQEVEYVSVWQSLDDFETRYTYAPQNEAAAIWIHSVLSSYGLQVEYFEHEQSGLRKNVIATHPGQGDPTKVVYLTGHFDSTSEDPMNHAPGADDNASGTAAFLEAARVLSQYDFEHTIKFAAFNGEEQGLVGSSDYVEHIFGQGEDVIGCFNLDMIAFRGSDPAPPDLMIYTDAASQPLAQVLHDAAVHYLPSDLEPIIIPEALGASDHGAFWLYGYKAVLGVEAQVWGAEFSPWYHTSNDRIEMYPSDYPTHVTMAATAAVAHQAIARSPDLPARPAVHPRRIRPARKNASHGGRSGGLPRVRLVRPRRSRSHRGIGSLLGASGNGERRADHATDSRTLAAGERSRSASEAPDYGPTCGASPSRPRAARASRSTTLGDLKPAHPASVLIRVAVMLQFSQNPGNSGGQPEIGVIWTCPVAVNDVSEVRVPL